MRQRRLAAALAVGIAAAGTALVPSAAAVAAVPAPARVAVAHPFARLASRAHFAAPPTTAQCRAAIGISCYSPPQFHRAYNMVPLYSAGLTGRGTTIAIVDSYGSPTIRHDANLFSRQFGLPRVKLQIISPAGAIPPYEPNAVRLGWAEETTLDVEYAHAMAPGAKILLVTTPVAETEGTVGLTQMMAAENYVINHHLADVITQSFGATEDTFPSQASLLRLRYAFKNAAAHGIPVLASSGDAGPTDGKFNGDLYTRQVNSWPSADPLVTSVGGTQLHLNARGGRTQPDNVWNDTALLGSPAAGGGGLSHVFARPSYQNGERHLVGVSRGTPDISLSAAVDGGALVYFSFPGLTAGYYIIGGTSEASPMLSGIVAIATQAAGHHLGSLNPALYRLGSGSAAIPDVRRGDTNVTFTQHGVTSSVKGYRALPGYDLATGLGTVNGSAMVRSLA